MPLSEPENLPRRPSGIPQPSGSSRRWSKQYSPNRSTGPSTTESEASLGRKSAHDENLDGWEATASSSETFAISPKAPVALSHHQESFRNSPQRQESIPEKPPAVPEAPCQPDDCSLGVEQRMFYPEHSRKDSHDLNDQSLVPSRNANHQNTMMGKLRYVPVGGPRGNISYPSYPPQVVGYADRSGSSQMGQQQEEKSGRPNIRSPPQTSNSFANNMNDDYTRNLRQRFNVVATGATGVTTGLYNNGHESRPSNPNLTVHSRTRDAPNTYYDRIAPTRTDNMGYPPYPPKLQYDHCIFSPDSGQATPESGKGSKSLQHDPERFRLEAELKAFKLAAEEAKRAKRQRELEDQIRKDTEEAFQKRMEYMKRAQEEAKEELEKAKAEAEHATRERMGAERLAEEEIKRQHDEMIRQVEESMRMKFQAELELAEEWRRLEEERKKAGEAVRIQLEASIKAGIEAKVAAEKRVTAESERRKAYEEEGKVKSEFGEAHEGGRSAENEIAANVEVQKAVGDIGNELRKRLKLEQEAEVRSLTVQSLEEITTLSNSILLQLKRERKAISDLLLQIRYQTGQESDRQELTKETLQAGHSWPIESQGRDWTSEYFRSGSNVIPASLFTNNCATHFRHLPPPDSSTPSSPSESGSSIRQPSRDRRSSSYNEETRRRLGKNKGILTFPVENLVDLIVDSLMARIDARERETVSSVASSSRCSRSLSRLGSSKGRSAPENIANNGIAAQTFPYIHDTRHKSHLAPHLAGCTSFIEGFLVADTEASEISTNAETVSGNNGGNQREYSECKHKKPRGRSNFSKSAYKNYPSDLGMGLVADREGTQDELGFDLLQTLAAHPEDVIKESSSMSSETWKGSFMNEDLIGMNLG